MTNFKIYLTRNGICLGKAKLLIKEGFTISTLDAFSHTDYESLDMDLGEPTIQRLLKLKTEMRTNKITERAMAPLD
jgi:hypothetical protein